MSGWTFEENHFVDCDTGFFVGGGRSTTLARPRTFAQTAATAVKADAAKEIFSAIARSVTESLDADLTSVQTGMEPAPLKDAARWAASAASARDGRSAQTNLPRSTTA